MTEDDSKTPTVSETGGAMRQGGSGRTHEKEMDTIKQIEKTAGQISGKPEVEEKKETQQDSPREVAFRKYALKQSLGKEKKPIPFLSPQPGEVKGERVAKDLGKATSQVPGSKKEGSQVGS